MLALLTALTLSVPYLPQTEALCGGAAAAMVFRFWGDRHADVQQFEPLVDTRAGGIADTVLVEAIRSRGWNAQRLDGSIATIREQVTAGHPLILLIEDRPSRYHYVVAVGADDENVFVHDPTWGPSRRIVASDLLQRWKPTGFWTLLVTSADVPARAAAPVAASAKVPQPPDTAATACDRLLDKALDTIEAHGPSVADEALEAVSRQCPAASAPLRELAAVRFSQQRWRDASALAERALDRNAGDSYAWDVLGSSRFILDDLPGALQAWNHIDKPRVDSIQITGLARTRYAFVAQFTSLAPNTLLTPRQLALADRRLRTLPDRVTTTVGYRPDADGFATVKVGIVERSRWPHGVVDWTSAGAQAAIDREVAVAVPGNTGQGEVWDAAWRWWSGRPRVAASFSAPRAGRFGGVWRVDGSWEAQTYGVQQAADSSREIRQEQTHGALSFSNWVSPHFRFEASSGLDVWDRNAMVESGADPLRTLLISGAIDRRWAADRASVAATATSWYPTGAGTPFRGASVRTAFRSTPLPAMAEPRGTVVAAQLRIDFASAKAPLAIWPGAGEGRVRPVLLRAHPLLHDGVIDGPAFGRQLQSATLEVQRWFQRPQLPRVGIALFADAAHAKDRINPAAGRPFQIDIGSGIRVHVPGSDRTLRVDYAHGLRDRQANTITFGWDQF